jgi:hypothetical protein
MPRPPTAALRPPTAALSRRALLHGAIGAGLFASLPAGPAFAAPAPALPPTGAAPYVPAPPSTAGANLQHSIRALNAPPDPNRPFVIWALGSSYTNALGNGRELIALLRAKRPALPRMVWRQDIGNSVPYQYLQGFAEGRLIPTNPDLVLVYAQGEAADLDTLLRRLRATTSADIAVPTLHWRTEDQALWGQSEDGVEVKTAELRAVAKAHGAELLEHRAEWARYLRENNLPLQALLRDKSHQTPYGAWMLQALLAAHLEGPASPNPVFRSSHQPLNQVLNPGEHVILQAEGQRFDLVVAPGTGQLQIQVDGRSAAEHQTLLQGPTERGAANARPSERVPRDIGPHGLHLERPDALLPERIDIEVIDGQGSFTVTGSERGLLGKGRSTEGFTTADGALSVPARWWRRPAMSTQGDRYSVRLERAVAERASTAVDPQAPRHTPKTVELRLATLLPAGAHTLRLEALDAPVRLRGLWSHRFG